MEYLEKLREISLQNHIPIIKDDGCDFLTNFCKEYNPCNILEIGTAVGYSGSHILMNTKNSHLTTIEINEKSYNMAIKTFEALNLTDRVTQILGNAKDIIQNIKDKFDLIFLDGPKGQYLSYYENLLKLLKKDGYIIADNMYFHGLVKGEEFVKHKLRTIVVNLRKFLKVIENDKRVQTKVLDIGDGIAIIKKL